MIHVFYRNRKLHVQIIEKYQIFSLLIMNKNFIFAVH